MLNIEKHFVTQTENPKSQVRIKITTDRTTTTTTEGL